MIYAQNSALSMHLSAKDQFDGDILMKTLKIPHKTLYTYYCALMWNVGGEAGGYCGLQNHPSGNNFIFSIWDPISTNEPIRAAYVGAGTEVENFGGEGTGLKSWNFVLDWAEDHEYQVVTRRWDVDGHTHFGYWVHDISSENWNHLVTMDFPVANVHFNTSTGSFLEDWSSTGANMRKVYQRDGYKRKTNGTWVAFNDMRHSINTGDAQSNGRSYNYRSNYDAGIEEGYYYMQAGGDTEPSFNGTSIELSNDFPEQPISLPVDFYVTNLTESQLEWTVPQKFTPQFKIIVKEGSRTLVDSIITDETSLIIESEEGDLLRISIEDILGNIVTKKINVGSNEFAPHIPLGLKVDDFGSSNFSVSWDPVENAEKYLVQIQDGLIWRTIDSTESLGYNYTNLEGRTRYRARVAAKNEFGNSAYSDFVFALTTVNNEKIIPNGDWSLKFVDSEELTGEDGAATNAFDNDENTFWHTEWSAATPLHPHELQIYLGAPYSIQGFKYLPRQDGGINGTISEYELYGSLDGEDWGEPISKGMFESNTELKEVDFDNANCSYIKLIALSEVNGGEWTSVSEISFVGEIIVGIESEDDNSLNQYKLYVAFPNLPIKIL